MIAILGATGGIGSALTRRLAAERFSLWLGARSEASLRQLAEETEAGYQVVDARDWTQLEQFLEEGEKQVGSLKGCALCVGSILLKPAHLTSLEQFQETIAVNLETAFGLVRSAVRLMRRQGGSIVLVSTAAVTRGLVNHEAIAAAKGGVEGLARAAAATYAANAIRVNCVAPGLVDTPLSKSITKNDAALEASKAMHALERIGKPEDVAGAIAWLLDSNQSWITGQVIGVDGGLARIQSRKAGGA